MKKPSLHFKKLSDTQFLIIWGIFHAAVLLCFLVNLIVTKGNISINTNLTDMLPKSFRDTSLTEIDNRLVKSTDQNVYILCSNPDFDVAKSTAESVYEQLKGSEFIEYINLYTEMGDTQQIAEFIHKYRFNLLDEESIDMINEPGGAEAFAQNALMQAYSPFTTLPLDNLDTDPFLLSETEVNHYLGYIGVAGPAVTLKDGVLCHFANDTWYVLLQGQLNERGAALASKTNGISQIYDICGELEKGDTRFIYSGTPFHSHTSSNSAMQEIGIITCFSLLMVIVLLVVVFKNPLPILFSVITIGISICTAFGATLSFFHNMHIITVLFGTSLIGSCIDYSVHYFTHWAGNDKLESGTEIRNHLLPGLSMAIVSSTICYAILLLAPFDLLKQMAMFSIFGLISSYLTTICLFPYIPLPKGNRNIHLEKKVIHPTRNAKRKKIRGRWVVSSIFGVSIFALLIFHSNIRINNDLNSMFRAKGRVNADDMEFAELMNYSISGWFIINGNSEEEVLNTERLFCKEMKKINGDGYISPTLFVPSIEQQKKSREACQKLIDISYYQYDALGFDSSYTDDLIREFEESEDDYLTMENMEIPSYLQDYISMIWEGNIDGSYYSVIVPNKINDSAALRELADSYSNVFYENNVEDRDNDLNKLTLMVLEFFAIAYLVMFVILKLFYNWKQAFKIISIPCLIILVTSAIYSAFRISLDFFTITGIILVFGLGLDYIIYMMENENSQAHSDTKTLEPFATLISFITTLLSFGALALSTFAPVHMLGLSIFIGLATAYISTMFYDRSL